jgi:hypothetical protein
VSDADSGTDSPKAFQVLVNRTASDIAAARQRNLRLVILAEKGTQKIVGCSDFFMDS